MVKCHSYSEETHLRATESLAVWDHTVLPATRHRWTCPACTRFTYPGGMEDWVDL